MIMKFYIPLYHPINLHGGDFGLITNLTKVKNSMAKTDLTNQRQVFVEEYVRSNNHLESIRKV